jgi:hypothetical protein
MPKPTGPDPLTQGKLPVPLRRLGETSEFIGRLSDFIRKKISRTGEAPNFDD